MQEITAVKISRSLARELPRPRIPRGLEHLIDLGSAPAIAREESELVFLIFVPRVSGRFGHKRDYTRFQTENQNALACV